MNQKMTILCWDIPKGRITPTQKFIMLSLAFFAHKETRLCYPSLRKIQAYTGYDFKTVFNSIKELIRLGLISCTAGNSTTPNRYTFNEDLLTSFHKQGDGITPSQGDGQGDGITPHGVMESRQHTRINLHDKKTNTNSDSLLNAVSVSSDSTRAISAEDAIIIAVRRLGDQKPSREKWRTFIGIHGSNYFLSVLERACTDISHGKIRNNGAYFNRLLDQCQREPDSFNGTAQPQALTDPRRFTAKDWTLCRERCANFNNTHCRCGCGFMIPPDKNPTHSYTPNECPRFNPLQNADDGYSVNRLLDRQATAIAEGMKCL